MGKGKLLKIGLVGRKIVYKLHPYQHSLGLTHPIYPYVPDDKLSERILELEEKTLSFVTSSGNDLINDFPFTVCALQTLVPYLFVFSVD